MENAFFNNLWNYHVFNFLHFFVSKKRAKSFFTNIELLCFFLFELLGFYFASFTPHLSNFLEENSNMVSVICFTKLLFPLHLSSLCIWAYILLKPELHIFLSFHKQTFFHHKLLNSIPLIFLLCTSRLRVPTLNSPLNF